MRLKFRDDYSLDKLDLMIGEFSQVFERSAQPFDVPDGIASAVLATAYPYRIDKPNGKFVFEDRLVFEQIAEAPVREAPVEVKPRSK